MLKNKIVHLLTNRPATRPRILQEPSLDIQYFRIESRGRILHNVFAGLSLAIPRGMLSSSFRTLVRRKQPVTLGSCRCDSIRRFSRTCRRFQADVVDILTPTDRIRNIAIIAHGG